MEHVVFFSETPGEPEFRRAGDLEEAVRIVESLRNERGIVDVSVHALTAVPMNFRTYYRVEVVADDLAPAASAEAPAAELFTFEVPAAEVSGSGVSGFEMSDFQISQVEGFAFSDLTIEESALEDPAVDGSAGSEWSTVPEWSGEVPSLASSPLLLLPPPPLEPDVSVFDLDEPVAEAADTDAADSADSAESAGSGASASLVSFDQAGDPDDLEAFAVYEPLVPQVRPEPEAERSLGYFAH